jgi:membrane associated rhomboid family serine protease
MSRPENELLLKLLQACADRAPEPLYPARYASENSLDRDKLDIALDELRSRGLIQLTDWVKDLGQGRAITDAGKEALETGNLRPAPPPVVADQTPTLSRYQRGELVRGALFDANVAYVSWTLVALNVAFFIYGAAYTHYLNLPVHDYLMGDDGAHRTTTHVVDRLGGLWYRPVLVNPRFMRPQVERIVLSAFLHIGVLHLAMNMFFLASLGGLIESMWGRWRYLSIYAVAGVVASCTVLSYDLWQQRDGLTAGASGALCGLFASMIVWFVFNHQHMPEELLRDWSRMLTINTMLLVGISLVNHVSWQGHLGGAIGGALAATLFQVQRFHPARSVRVLALIGVLLVPVLALLGVFWQAGWFTPR